MSSQCDPGPTEETEGAHQPQARARRPRRAARQERLDGQTAAPHLHVTPKRKLRSSSLSSVMRRRVRSRLSDMETRSSALVPESDMEHSDVVDLTSELVEADVVDLTSLDSTEVIDVESDHSMTEAQRQRREEEDEDILEVLGRDFPEVRLLQEEASFEEVRQDAQVQGELGLPMMLVSDEEDGEVQLLSPAGPSTRSNTAALVTRARCTGKPAVEGESTISCPLCLDEMNQVHMSGRLMCSTVCGHVFCSVCIRDAIKSMAKCPFCRKKLTLKQYHPIYI